MRKSLKVLFVASAFVAGIAAAPTLYAHDSQNSQGSMMGPSMMGQGDMMGGGNMMGMMSQMIAMMENCNKMMQGMMENSGPGAPNDQWRKEEPAKPDEQG